MIILLFNSNIFLFILFILLGNYQINSYLSFTHQTSIVLKNHNIFVIHKEGITICNSEFKKIIKNEYTFQLDEQISTEDKLSKILIRKFDDGYIICLIIDRIYFFDVDGNFNQRTHSLVPYGIEEELFFTIVPHKIENSYYYYIVGYIYQQNLYLSYYKYKFQGIFETNLNKITYLKVTKDTIYEEGKKYIFSGKFLSCEFLQYFNQGEALICGYYSKNNNQNTFCLGFFIFNDLGQLIVKEGPFPTLSRYDEEVLGIKSIVTYDHLYILMCFYLSNGKMYCQKNKFKDLEHSLYQFNVFCLPKYYGLKIEYHEDKEEYTVSCLAETAIGGIQVITFSKDLNSHANEIFKYGNCEYIHGYSLIYNLNKNNYYIISDVKCNNKNYPFQPLIGNINEDEEKEEEEEEEKEEEEKEEKDYEEEEEKDEEEKDDEEEEIEHEIYKCKELEKCKLCYNQSLSDNLLINNITDNVIDNVAKNFVKEFNYTNNHILIFNNSIYSIILYKNSNCISELNLNIPELNFGECYKKIKFIDNIEEDLIIGIITKNIEGKSYPKIIYYSIYEPKEGQKISLNQICNNLSLEIKEDILIKIDAKKKDINSIKHLMGQNIDIFSLSSLFYSDICYDFDSPINKDISLKDRIISIYPNITLCENDCQVKEINSTNFKVICECKINNLTNNISYYEVKDNEKYQNYFSEIEKSSSQTNIGVVKCYKSLINAKKVFSNVGFYIFFIFLIFHIILTIIYYTSSLLIFSKYINSLTEAFFNKYILENNNEKKDSLKLYDKYSINNPNKKTKHNTTREKNKKK